MSCSGSAREGWYAHGSAWTKIGPGCRYDVAASASNGRTTRGRRARRARRRAGSGGTGRHSPRRRRSSSRPAAGDGARAAVRGAGAGGARARQSPSWGRETRRVEGGNVEPAGDVRCPVARARVSCGGQTPSGSDPASRRQSASAASTSGTRRSEGTSASGIQRASSVVPSASFASSPPTTRAS